MNTWGKAAGNGPLGLDWSGCYPAMVIPFTDQTCREVDYDAFRSLTRDLLEADIAGLDPNEVEGLSREETIKLMEIAKEEAGGRIPVTGKVEARNGQWTWDLVEEAEKVAAAGADVLYVHPWPEGDYGPSTNWEDFINLYKTFDRAVNLPIIGLMAGIPVPVIKEISLQCENIAAWKYASGQNMGLQKQMTRAMRQVEEATGRHIAPLIAGDESLVESLINGAEGNFSGGACWRGRQDVDIVNAVKRGDLAEAFAIQKRIEPATELVRGNYGEWTWWRFPYRYKIATWLLGKIPNHYARLPRTEATDEVVLALRQGLIDAGFTVVRDVEECRGLQAATA